MKKTENPRKRRTLSAEKIVTKAMELADKDGTDALSMRKLAGSLGATAMSLYNHVDGKDQLLGLMLDRVVAKIESPDTDGEWELMLRRRAHSMRHVLLRHRWASALLISRIIMSDVFMRDVNSTTGCLITAGFTYAQADWARNAIDSHIYGYTIQELSTPVQPEDYISVAKQYLPMISKTDFPFIHAAVVQIIDEKYDGKTDFDFGLDLIFDGLKRWLAKG